MYVPCHSGYGKPDMVQIHAIAVQGFPEARISGYALILLRSWPLRRCFFAGMLTGQKKHRIVNLVIVQFYRLGLIIGIMRRVSECNSSGWRFTYRTVCKSGRSKEVPLKLNGNRYHGGNYDVKA